MCRPTMNSSPRQPSAAPRPSTPAAPAGLGPADADAPWAVVDDQLRVHGLQGLRVIDASIMPRMISANLNASTMMIADKASDIIRDRKLPEAVVGSIAG
jgi:choline dehydrogenase